MDMLTEFVDQLAAETGAPSASTTASFPTLDEFDEGATGALKWKDLVTDRVYQILSARSIHTQHGTSFVLSLQTADGFCLGLGMWDTNERATAEPQYARGPATVIHTTNRDEEEQERETV